MQEFIFIALDIFQKKQHNISDKTLKIKDKLDAWLAFLSMDEPEDIVRLITEYPEFKPLYEDIYWLCRNMERVMGIFSEELLELDRNTVQYMIDEMQDTIDAQNNTIDAQNSTIIEQKDTISSQQDLITRQQQENNSLKKQLEELLKRQGQNT